MESETVLGDITNVVTKNGEKVINNLDQRVALIRINPVKASYLNFHEEWSGRCRGCGAGLIWKISLKN